MGVLALGIGFGSPLALAGVVLHVAGHALAKSLAFYTATPLLRLQPNAGTRPPAGLARADAWVATACAVSLLSLSALPPSPLFFSELFVLLGGFLSGDGAAAAVAATLLALGFFGLAHALIESLFGRARVRSPASIRTARSTVAVTGTASVGLAALSCAAFTLPDSGLVDAVARWASG
jgi:hydrogenase-4 component F